MRDRIDQLRDSPLMGQPQPDPILVAAGFRKLVLTQTYIAIHKVMNDTVTIYAIVNGRSDYPRLLR